MHIDTSEKFATLPNSPIVEAVIHWRVQPSKELTREHLAAITDTQSEHESETIHELESRIESDNESVSVEHKSRFDGFKIFFPSKIAPKFIAQFKLQELIFSQLAPYKDWDEFSTEALRCWDIYNSIVETNQVKIGVRFISQMSLDEKAASDWINISEDTLSDLGLKSSGFFRKDTFDWPDSPFQLCLISATRESPRSLMVDIDVIMKDQGDVTDIVGTLLQMRFIKNKVFFAYMKEPIKTFGGGA
jgi:uncharacterized protein (TIGR04255 family)